MVIEQRDDTEQRDVTGAPTTAMDAACTIGATQTFDALVRLSQASNRKLRDVARLIVDTLSADADHG